MDIGEQERVIIVEPMEVPEGPVPAGPPVSDPTEPEPVPADQPDPAGP